MNINYCGCSRFLSLNKPGNCFISGRVARVIIAFVWVGILGVGSPLIVWCDVIPTTGQSLSCTTVGVDARTIAIFIVLTRVLTFFFPLGMIFMSYFGIWYKLVFSAKKVMNY